MNINNLNERKAELAELGFDEKLIGQVEQKMKEGSAERLSATERRATPKGHAELTVHLKRSTISDHYYLNKFHVLLGRGEPLEADKQYLVLVSEAEGKNSFKKFDSVAQAVDYFKRLPDAELATGIADKKHLEGRNTLALRAGGKLSFVEPEFSAVLNDQVRQQTFYLTDGKTFSSDQAVNLLEGRAVFRDNMLTHAGVRYEAWVEFDFDKGRNEYNNVPLRTYREEYKFDLMDTLSRYQIRELDDPAKRETLAAAIKNGHAPLVNVNWDGENVPMRVVINPRYRNADFYRENGEPVKREQLLKESRRLLTAGKSRRKGKEQEQGLGI